MDFTIKKGAILLADAHENKKRQTFFKLLKALENGQIKTPQLILLGDIFDLFIGEIQKTHEFAKSYINLLKKLSQSIEIWYFEGNHDFNLKSLLKEIHVFDMKNQPLFAKIENSSQNIALAHGDIFLKFHQQIALKTLRNHHLLLFLAWLDKIMKGIIYKQIINKKKNLLKKIPNFEQIVSQRIQKYKAFFSKKNIKKSDEIFIIEGHFHQNFRAKNYFNLPAFVENQSFFVVEFKPEFNLKLKNLSDLGV